MLDELESVIVSETDYTREAANLVRFGKGLKPLGYVDVPKPIPEYSTDRVLTMTLLGGEHLEGWLAHDPPRRLRNRLGKRLFELFYHQIHFVKALHADPHPGNYLFSGDGEIGLVDFGCVKEIAPEVVESLKVIALSGETLKKGKAEHIVDLLWQGETPKKKHDDRMRNIEACFEFSKLVIPPKGSPVSKVNFGDRVIFEELTQLSKTIIGSK
jgi:predicted unusual protein kinase regulating ubiquinone biosynthesis (AarF/ABC1/UbiB family)